jgi:hypothetical protein
MGTMELLQFLEGAGNENNVTISILVSGGSDVTITFCASDAHLCTQEQMQQIHSIVL